MDTVDTIRKALDIAVSLNLPFTAYAKMGFDIFATMRAHTGLSNEELIEGAKTQLDENEKRILKNLSELPPSTPAVTPAASPATSPAPAKPEQPSTPTAPATAPTEEAAPLNIEAREKKIAELKARLAKETDLDKRANLRGRIERNEIKLAQQKMATPPEGKI